MGNKKIFIKKKEKNKKKIQLKAQNQYHQKCSKKVK